MRDTRPLLLQPLDRLICVPRDRDLYGLNYHLSYLRPQEVGADAGRCLPVAL